MNKHKKIDFIGIGAPKCATTWIYSCLIEHPQICGPRNKELHFFSNEYFRGINWYHKQFKNCPDNKVLGEFSPSYFENPQAVQRIYEHFPNIKIIVCLRHPIERIISQYYFDKSRHQINKDLNSYLNDPSSNQFLYFKNLQKYINLFPKENILILFYQDLKNDPRQLVKKIYTFLNVDTDFVPINLLNKKVNISVRNRAKIKIINNIIWSIYNRINNSRNKNIYINLIRKSGLKKIAKKIIRINRKSSDLKSVAKEKPNEKIISSIKKSYQNDINKLENFTNRNLSDWNS